MGTGTIRQKRAQKHYGDKNEGAYRSVCVGGEGGGRLLRDPKSGLPVGTEKEKEKVRR